MKVALAVTLLTTSNVKCWCVAYPSSGCLTSLQDSELGSLMQKRSKFVSVDMQNVSVVEQSTAARSDDKMIHLEWALKLDENASQMFPGVLPAVPVMYPEVMEARDRDIAPKLRGLNRSSRIRVRNDTEVPYWQTLQYADRHFGIHVDRFRGPWWTGGNKYYFIPNNLKSRAWAASGLLRKLLCTERFRIWVFTSLFSGRTREDVYRTFQNTQKGTYFGVRDLSRGLAIANSKGAVINNKMFLQIINSPRWLIGILAHEQAHNLGFSHATGVPYPIGNAMTLAVDAKAYDYEVHDLSKTPDFEVVSAPPTPAPKYIGDPNDPSKHPYVHSSRGSALAACQSIGNYRLCTQSDIWGFSKCAAGWLSDWKGYWMKESVSGCGQSGYNSGGSAKSGHIAA